MMLRCRKCNHVWDYQGKSNTYVSCSLCKSCYLLNHLSLNYREQGKCEKCKQDKDIEIHHIIPRSRGLDNNITNLMLLCHSCHMKIKKTHRQSKEKRMKTINVTFDDEEFERLIEIKKLQGVESWREFILGLI